MESKGDILCDVVFILLDAASVVLVLLYASGVIDPLSWF